MTLDPGSPQYLYARVKSWGKTSSPHFSPNPDKAGMLWWEPYILKATQSAEFVCKTLRKKCVNYDDKISRQKCEIIKITRISCQCGIFVENTVCFYV